ncbi:MAG: tRNA (N(6)-L-threonylcarbamoyladenosine(37)-C(2))-methylthiotransferase MtaB [Nitrospirae bacterium]|nr:tRNA (N(6)-L-threonylcarbamoyladenosine(37)-C(2))-methylthiotransferase MtaB [Nitrospirota bacterium]
MKRIAFSTLGCKVNQYDTAVIESAVIGTQDYTIVPFDDTADIYVVNTCTVTGKGDAESRRLIRKAVRSNKHAQVVVTGCYAQTNPEEIAGIPGVTMVVGNEEKYSLVSLLKDAGDIVVPPHPNPLPHGEREFSIDMTGAKSGNVGEKVFVGDIFDNSSMQNQGITKFPNHTRAFMKVQDGCDSRCSYCIVPFARGRSRSLNPDKVINQIKLFEGNGYKEVVLCGVHLGGYGRDIAGRLTLSVLIKRIISETGIRRIRLSSIEPREITDELINLMASEDRICKHFHIPLQSGDDMVLKMMNRNYTAGFFEDLVLNINENVRDSGIGCDVMVGFPGEGDDHFENTFKFVEKLPVSYLHVFSYSPRAGTAACNLKETVRGDVKQKRGDAIRKLADVKHNEFVRKFTGNIFDVLIEYEKDEVTGFLKGYTGNYLKVLITENSDYDDNALMNNIVDVHITGIVNGNLAGEVGRKTVRSKRQDVTPPSP